MIEITSGELLVLHSGTVRTGTSPEITFKIEDLTFKFIFVIDQNKGGTLIEPIGNNENKTLTINLINHTNSIGSGIAEPIKVGTLNERNLYLSFETRKVNNFMTWSLDYTFYLGGQV